LIRLPQKSSARAGEFGDNVFFRKGGRGALNDTGIARRTRDGFAED
jgi:hypothetical protein